MRIRPPQRPSELWSCTKSPISALSTPITASRGWSISMIFSVERNSGSMAALSLPRGLIVDLVTPLKQNGDIDGRSLGRHLDRVLPNARAVLIAGPPMGGGENRSDGQSEELME